MKVTMSEVAIHHHLSDVHGWGSTHCASPAELVMEREDGEGARAVAAREDGLERARCLMTVLMAVTWQVQSLVEIRDRVACLAMRWWPMRVPRSVWHGRLEWSAARQALARCRDFSWHAEAGPVLLELLMEKGWEPYEVGKRALLLLYAFQQDEAMRPPMARSYETIGMALGLTAENKRSAVAAGMQRHVGPLLARAGLTGTGEHKMRLWCMKGGQTRAKIQQKMMGKRNRSSGRAAEKTNA